MKFLKAYVIGCGLLLLFSCLPGPAEVCVTDCDGEDDPGVSREAILERLNGIQAAPDNMKIKVSWSDVSDLVSSSHAFELKRKKSSESDFSTLHSLLAQDTEHLDNTAEALVIYSYKIVIDLHDGHEPLESPEVNSILLPAPEAPEITSCVGSGSQTKVRFVDKSISETRFIVEVSSRERINPEQSDSWGPWSAGSTNDIPSTTMAATGDTIEKTVGGVTGFMRQYRFRVKAANASAMSGYTAYCGD